MFILRRKLILLLVIFSLAGLIDFLLIQPWHIRWGATDAEVERAMPSDDLMKNATYVATRAITINTGIADVWPWLVQIGEGRGGFYSYDGLERLVGCNISNADRIITEYQHLEAGDEIPL